MVKSSIFCTAAVFLALAAPSLAKGPPRALTDWPCDTPFAGPLDAEMLWPGIGDRAVAEGAWQQDAVARRFVEFLTAGENSPAMGQREIETFAEENGPFPPETAFRVVAGMVERGNTLRRILLQGIKQQIIKSHVLAEAIAKDDASIAAAVQQNSDEARRHAAAIKEARRQNMERLDDADDTAEQLCHRLVYDEAKLRRLAAALKAHTR